MSRLWFCKFFQPFATTSATFFQKEGKSVWLILSEHFPLYLAGLCSYIRWCILGKSWPQSSSNLLKGKKNLKLNYLKNSDATFLSSLSLRLKYTYRTNKTRLWHYSYIPNLSFLFDRNICNSIL